MNEITKNYYKDIKDKLGSRDYRLGLDLGVGSIGYCAIALDNNDEDKQTLTEDIVLIGSRIFTPSSGAAERRKFRSQRNTHRHNRERKRFLWKLLASKGLALSIPVNLEKKEDSSDEETSKKRFPLDTLKKDPYTIRYNAINENPTEEKKLSKYDLGYCLYHLSNHRGTASVRTFLEDEEEAKKEKSETAKIANNVIHVMKSKGYKTYGEFLYKENIADRQSNKKDKVTNRNKKKFAVTRDIILSEILIILTVQKRFFPEILTDDYINELISAINYESEKLIPESGLCPYFKTEKRLPKSHKLNEYRRIYEALNNARFFIPVIDSQTAEILSYSERSFFDDIGNYFTKEKRDKLFDYLIANKKLTASVASKILELPAGTEIQLQGKDKKTQEIKGYALIDLENMLFWSRLTEEQQDNFLYDWNSIPDEQILKEKLKNIYKLSNEEIKCAFSKLVLSSAYAPVGKKAMEIILSYIRNGYSYTEAIEEAINENKFQVDKNSVLDNLPYYGKILSDSTQKVIAKGFSKQFKDKEYSTPITNKDEEKYGRIANPVVHQTLNELRKLVNEIILILGKKPFEITIETSRELKQSQKKREEISKEQSDNEEKRKRLYDTYIKGHQFKKDEVNIGNYILKFDLLEEQSEKCPFCLKTITSNDVIQGTAEIEHLFPIEESEDNTRNNIVLAHTTCNADKGARAPFDAFGHLTSGKYIWNNILSNLTDQTNSKNFRNKAWRFYQGSFEKFLENKPMKKRFSTDISYISKISQKYLSSLYDKPTKIFCAKGSLTAQLRLAWGVNGVLIPFAKKLLTEEEIKSLKEFSVNKKVRIDNRHHALDALVLAFANRGYHNFLNKVHAEGYKINYKEKNWLSKILIPPMNKNLEEFGKFIESALESANVSIKHDHNANGQLFKKTLYKTYFVDDQKSILTTLKKLEDIKFPEKEKPGEILEKNLCKFETREDGIKDNKLKEKIKYNSKLYQKIKNVLPQAKKDLEEANQQAKLEGKKERKITEISIYKKACSLISGKYYQISNKLNQKFASIKNPTQKNSGFGYDTDENSCLDLYYDDTGKLCGENIRKINAMQNKQPEYKKNGYSLLERIYQGDILELDKSNDKISLINATNSAPKNRVFVKIKTFTEAEDYFTKNNKDRIQIQFCNILKSMQKEYDSFYISSMQKYNPRKVILTSTGIIKYRSTILKNKEK